MAEQPTLEEIYISAIKELDKRFRFPRMEDLIEGPTTMEKQIALQDAVTTVNVTGLATSYTLESIFGPNGDVRVRYLVFLATAANIIRNTLLPEWTANGITVNIEEFSIEDRKDRYEALASKLDEQFDKLCASFKESTQKFVRRVNVHNSNPLSRSPMNINASGIARRYR